ncbi:glycosyltransferase [Streptomyces sp. NPDC059443]|uniref:glycosyltransferase n=1 Tax=unclassified Streptomyces TaxID=2593676 RepID=UPI0036771D96
MKISFLMHSAYGLGGATQATFTLAEELVAQGQDVEIASVLQTADAPFLDLDDRVPVVPLVDKRPSAADRLAGDPDHGGPSSLLPTGVKGLAAEYDRLVEREVRTYLRETEADVVIATHAGLIVLLAHLGSDRYIRIGQEHDVYETRERSGKFKPVLHAAYAEIDALATVTEEEAALHRAKIFLPETRIATVPNGVPSPGVTPSSLDSKIVMAAGRLVGGKHYDVIVKAFAEAVRHFPDWQLRLYGRGEAHDSLRQLILDLGIHNNARLMGAHSSLGTEWAKASIAASASVGEAFGLTIAEAMHCGVPVVTTPGPGPSEIVEHGTNGFITPVGDVEQYARYLMKLMHSHELRASFGGAALRTAQRYLPEHAATSLLKLIGELESAKSLRPVADCWVDHAGNTLIHTKGGGLPGEEHRLVCVNTQDPDRESVDFPFERVGEHPGQRAVLPRRHHFATGLWKVFVRRLDDGAVRAVRVDRCDTRALVGGQVKDFTQSPAHFRHPFRHKADALAFESRTFPQHAEVRRIVVDGSAIHVMATVMGAHADPSLTAFARSRTSEELNLRIPCEPAPDNAVTFSVPAALFDSADSGRELLWDLHLIPRSGAELIRIGSFDGDVRDARTLHFPSLELPWAVGGPCRLQPYISTGNWLSLRHRPVKKN